MKKASELFVLVTMDYPNDQSKQTKPEIKRNQELLKLYNIKAYPTLLLLDEAGRPYAEGGMIMKTADHLRI